MACFLEDESETGLCDRQEMLLQCLQSLLLFRDLNLKGAECSQLSLTSMSPSPQLASMGSEGTSHPIADVYPTEHLL